MVFPAACIQVGGELARATIKMKSSLHESRTLRRSPASVPNLISRNRLLPDPKSGRQKRPHPDPTAKQAIRSEIEAIEASGHWHVRGAVILPDHLHLWVNLGVPLTLSRVVARLKSKTRGALAASRDCWQDNYYEHRIRPHDDIGRVLGYIFLNPYRAELVPTAEQYPWFWLGSGEQAWFEPGLDDGRPFAEWLR